MTTTTVTSSDYTPEEVRDLYEQAESGYFFSDDTMRFFGDTMDSYGTICLDGVEYMYRDPSARVNVFGRTQRAGRQFFGAWKIEPVEGGVDMGSVSEETKQAIYDAI